MRANHFHIHIQNEMKGEGRGGSPTNDSCHFSFASFHLNINKTNSMLTRNLLVYLKLIDNIEIIKKLSVSIGQLMLNKLHTGSGHHLHACVSDTVIELESRRIYLSRLCRFRDTNAFSIIPSVILFFFIDKWINVNNNGLRYAQNKRHTNEILILATRTYAACYYVHRASIYTRIDFRTNCITTSSSTIDQYTYTVGWAVTQYNIRYEAGVVFITRSIY